MKINKLSPLNLISNKPTYFFSPILFCALLFCGKAYSQKTKQTGAKVENKEIHNIDTTVDRQKLVEISTFFGKMVVRLYDATPKHRDNFLKLVREGFYDSLLFHRVIREFMIQGGDPASKHADSSAMLGMGSAPGDRIPAEFNPNFFHKKGALAAARDNNPTKASSNCQFYIVQGKRVDTAQLSSIYNSSVKAANPNFKYSGQQKEIYQRIGGTPSLDQNYTVFGEVISGLDVIDKIASVPTKPGDRPAFDVRMKMRILN